MAQFKGKKHNDISYLYSHIFCGDGEVVRTGTLLGDYLRSHIFMTENIENPKTDLADVSQFGIEHSGFQTSFFIPTSNGEVGAWYLEPVSEL